MAFHIEPHRKHTLWLLVLPFILVICLPSFTLGQGQSSSVSAGEIYKKASPAVVLIELYNSKGEVSKTGSGFLVSNEGAILTNYHVIAHSKQATVRLASGDAYDTVEVLDIDKRKDIALIKIKAIGLPSLKLSRSNTVAVGDVVFSLSNPLGVLQNSLSQGIVSGIRQGDGYRYFQISAPISPGSSGGPIFNTKGEVVGIAVATMEGGQNLNFAVPIDYAKGMLSSTAARPLASIYEPEPEVGDAAEGKQGQQTTGKDECDANEVWRLGRSLGEKDDEIADAIKQRGVCTVLSYLNGEAYGKTSPSQQPQAQGETVIDLTTKAASTAAMATVQSGPLSKAIALRKRFSQHKRDFLDFAKLNYRNKRAEYEVCMAFSVIAERTYESLNSTIALLEVYENISSSADRARIQPLIRSDALRYSKSIETDIPLVNDNLANTKLPGIAATGDRMKQDLRDAKAFLDSLQTSLE
jgi:S1-C subfamily serine protease